MRSIYTSGVRRGWAGTFGAMVLLLGADQGDPTASLEQAEELIAVRVGPVLARSRAHWTAAWGFVSDALFLNRALLVDPRGKAPLEVLHIALDIEQGMGRRREPEQRYGPRIIDIDILFSGNEVIDAPGLQVPHPQVQGRYFALAPAADIVPGLRHPQLDRTVMELLSDVMQRTAHG